MGGIVNRKKPKVKFGKAKIVRSQTKLMKMEKIDPIVNVSSLISPINTENQNSRMDSGYMTNEFGSQATNLSKSIKRSRDLTISPISTQQSISFSPQCSFIDRKISKKRKIAFGERDKNIYIDKINQTADTMCEICYRIFYPGQTRKQNRTNKIAMITNKMKFEVESTFDVCRTCSTYIFLST